MPRKPQRGRGRPPFKPTPAMRRRVSIGAAGGMTHEELAIALGIARETLEKHFERELSVVAHQRRLDVLDAMYSTAIGSKVTGVKPNVAAQKAFVAASIALSPTPVSKTPKVDAPTTEKQKGKKEQANDDAVTAQVGTEWADLLKPSARPQ